jgi:hypothetical protein
MQYLLFCHTCGGQGLPPANCEGQRPPPANFAIKLLAQGITLAGNRKLVFIQHEIKDDVAFFHILVLY